MELSTWITLGVIVLAIVWAVAIYNQLVSLSNRYKNGFAQIEVQLKRRYDLIPNLVETAKGYLSHERETLEAVIMARNEAAAALGNMGGGDVTASGIKSLAGAENALAGALGKLNVVMEAYPDLKASANMQQLSEELTSTEPRGLRPSGLQRRGDVLQHLPPVPPNTSSPIVWAQRRRGTAGVRDADSSGTQRQLF